MAGKGRVVDLEVQPIFAGEVMALEEAPDRGNVIVVLVFGRLLGLRLDEEEALEPDPVLVLGDDREEPGKLLLLLGEIRVEQGLVTLASAP